MKAARSVLTFSVTSRSIVIDVTIVTTEGTYASGMPGGAPTPKNAWTVDFDALVKSLRRS